jgi:hypothetical protein
METTLVVLSAFSVSMIPEAAFRDIWSPEPIVRLRAEVSFEKVTLGAAREFVDAHWDNVMSAVGHEATARVLSNQLRAEIPLNRVSVALDREHDYLLAQVMPYRLLEGQVLTESEMASVPIDFYVVRLTN